jgi:tripartite-type tricarboxylate transporter receptor subunit TctC
MDNIVILTPHVKSGAVSALAVSTAKRSPVLPNVPALAEAASRRSRTSIPEAGSASTSPSKRLRW